MKQSYNEWIKYYPLPAAIIDGDSKMILSENLHWKELILHNVTFESLTSEIFNDSINVKRKFSKYFDKAVSQRVHSFVFKTSEEIFTFVGNCLEEDNNDLYIIYCTNIKKEIQDDIFNNAIECCSRITSMKLVYDRKNNINVPNHHFNLQFNPLQSQQLQSLHLYI